LTGEYNVLVVTFPPNIGAESARLDPDFRGRTPTQHEDDSAVRTASVNLRHRTKTHRIGVEDYSCNVLDRRYFRLKPICGDGEI
jgi:hypothetical protein